MVAKAVVILALLTCGGCAAVFNGPREEISFSSEPTGARVTVNGETRGTTPVLLKLERRNSHVVKLEMDGRRPYECIISKTASPLIAVDIVLFSVLCPIPLLIDHLNGGWYKLDPDRIYGTLAPVDSTHTEK